VLVEQRGQTEHVAKTMGQGETHGCDPFRSPQRRAVDHTKWGFYAAPQQ
jgi:hypothetical protein